MIAPRAGDHGDEDRMRGSAAGRAERGAGQGRNRAECAIGRSGRREAGDGTFGVPVAGAGKASMLAAVPRALIHLALALSLVSAACIPSGELVAIDGSHRMLARDPQSGISVVLTTGAWQGIPGDLDEQVTVLHVLVANLGDKPIRLAPGDLALVDERGFKRDLLDAGGSFVQQGQHAGGYHPGRSLDYGQIEWVGGDVASSALPWGILAPGTSMRGYVYFQRVDQRGNAATLTWHFHDGDGRPVVDLTFDLFVARART